ncbi:hypothetical protein [Pseudorhodobacter sp.]|uniref:hypothetical protein n=1 Tax=Pseudorhodobacter sp. TaxID=1934400 RepID=UPI0026471BB0|nr:hypothetical protein [Pseudorhodobacter sp.]MDN5788140.1 hypothetical protein [Pseudorhodobacter sp.]
MTDDRLREIEKALEIAKWRYSTHGLSAGQHAYDYGVLVVKNAFLVSGGGLFFVPTMVAMSPQINLGYAFVAGTLFGAGVILALLANYFIHINWLLNEAVWDDIYNIEKIDIRAAYNVGFSNDGGEREKSVLSHKKKCRWINLTFWVPHALAIIFVVVLVCASFNLYEAFGLVLSEVNK